MSKVMLRPAIWSDAAPIASIYNESIAVGDATMDQVPTTGAAVLARMKGFSEREGYLVLECDGEVQGWGVIKRYSDRAGYRYTAETAVYLRRDQRGRGYGTRIKKALIERCRAHGYHHLVAKIFADNRVSIALNERLGYEVVGTQRQIGFARGHWQDVVILQLVLDTPAEEPG